MTGGDIFELAYKVIGGLGVFLFGMKMLSESLQAVASDFIRRVIGWLTNNRIMAVCVGLIVTTIVQSSSVTTVMVVGFVNAGLMSLAQAVGVILGANIGTTITGWIIAIKIGKYGLVFIGAGFAPFFFTKGNVSRNIGKVLIALGLVFLGLGFMSGGFKPLAGSEGFKEFLLWFTADSFISVIGCVIIGCILTFIVQSSSAMLAITMSLAFTGTIQFPTAAALVLGENIGTTVTALLASIGGNVNARRAAYAHSSFNVLGVLVMIVIFQPYIALVGTIVDHGPEWLTSLFKVSGEATSDKVDPLVGMKIALGHSLFNVTNTLIFLPLLPFLVKFVTWLKPDKGLVSKKRLKLLGNIAVVAPELAFEEAEREIELMGDLTLEGAAKTRELVEGPTEMPDHKARVDHIEQITDNIQMEVTLFLTTVLQMPLTPEQANRAYGLIRLSDEIESVTDYCQSLVRYKGRLLQEGHTLSDAARAELGDLMAGTEKFLADSLRFVRDNLTAEQDDEDVRTLIRASDALGDKADVIRGTHLARIKDGTCDPLAGLTFSDMIVALRRIKNHTVNIIDARIGSWEERREALRVLDRSTDEITKV